MSKYFTFPNMEEETPLLPNRSRRDSKCSTNFIIAFVSAGSLHPISFFLTPHIIFSSFFFGNKRKKKSPHLKIVIVSLMAIAVELSRMDPDSFSLKSALKNQESVNIRVILHHFEISDSLSKRKHIFSLFPSFQIIGETLQ